MAGAPEQQTQANRAEFVFRVGEADFDQLRVTAFSGSEGLSSLYSIKVDVCSDERELDGNTLVAQPCLFKMSHRDGERLIHGVVRSFARVGDGDNLTYYSIEVVPVHWMLTRRVGSMIFQEHNCSDMTIPGIIKKVLLDAGIQADFFRFALQREYTPREYVVQYRESEFDFIARLMEEEGVFYYFEHAADKHVMVFGDTPSAHQMISAGISGDVPDGADDVPFRTASGLVQEKEYILGLAEKHEVQVGRTLIDDYDFNRPDKQLRSVQEASEKNYLLEEDYPGRYSEKETGQRFAEQRLQEFQWQRRVTTLKATARMLISGYKFNLVEHPVERLNGEYLLVGVNHTGTQPSAGQENVEGGNETKYGAEATVIPAATPFRPKRQTSKPTVKGTQTAIVVGPKGEEIYTDKYGRVKVQFHWDQDGRYDENSSRWIRVSQGAAGGQYGMMFLPRIGQEVVVDHLEGDPDQPIIVGSVYNADNMPPHDLPANKTRSGIKSQSSKGGGGTNEIILEDSKDGEKFSMHAQKDFHLRVTNDRIETVERDQHLTVKRDMNELIERDESTQIDGSESHVVGGTQSITVSKDVVYDFKAGHKHEVAAALAIKADSIKLEAASSIELTCGGSTIVLCPGGVYINGSMVYINSGNGPAAADVSASATGAVTPLLADDSTPGKDVSYTTDPNNGNPIKIEPTPSQPPPPKQTTKKSWIKIRLVDELEKPVPGEKYRVTCPGGEVKDGRLDANGMAHIGGIDPGSCEITFPELDRTAWKRKA